MDKRKIVIGFPRSGTCSIAKELNIGHEVMNENGTSDWRLAFQYKRRENDELIHVMRNPKDSIASNLFTMRNSSLQFMREQADVPDKSLLGTLVECFIKWTEQIESLNPDKIVIVEDLETIANTRIHPKIIWKDLECLPVKDINKLKEIAVRYGYDTND